MMVLVVKGGFFVLRGFDSKYIHKYGYIDKNSFIEQWVGYGMRAMS